MSIEILPARLANQIAAGEVVERPASVIKELVENSLDAGATSIKIEIEKGGAKRIRIADNGHGIVKEELTLALSRHATSKIKNITDLEGINSLGFRGEALASISSVARLTLTSKPAEQESAWQACAQGRDMDVVVQPAAHPNGTTIDVLDLFFNTPARRKFLRTEKTEFAHIEEVIKRIALANFNVAFTLTHNGNVVRQYRQATTPAQNSKRVAQVCGQSFIDHALEVNCQHEGLQLHGWIALPSYTRKQNDLCYSYVNGRMMRDKLINHAIRQSYNDMLPSDSYPAFVLFLQLDCRDVDVNVHPAKHEVRFHQGRYVHDFIYSVCHQALIENQSPLALPIEQEAQASMNEYRVESKEYIAPLTQVAENNRPQYRATSSVNYNTLDKVATSAINAYQHLVSPSAIERQDSSNKTDKLAPAAYENDSPTQITDCDEGALQFVAPHFAICSLAQQIRLISLPNWQVKINQEKMKIRWQQGIVSQPLLLPVKMNVSPEQYAFTENNLACFEKLGIILQLAAPEQLQIRQFPALLRHRDVSSSIYQLLTQLIDENQQQSIDEHHWQQAFILLMCPSNYDESCTKQLWQEMVSMFPQTINQELRLNSVKVDLTSAIQQLNNV